MKDLGLVADEASCDKKEMRKTAGEFLVHVSSDKVEIKESHIKLLFEHIHRKLTSIYQKYKLYSSPPAESSK